MEAYIAQNALLVYAMVMIAAALLHWGQKVSKGEANSNFMAYWFTETPGYSMGTLGALVGAWWLVYTTKGLDNMAAHMVVESAFATGWLINSAISAGSNVNIPAKQGGFVRLGLFPLLIIGALGAFVMLTQGCAGNVMNPGASIKVPETLPEAGQEAQKIINGANVLLTSAYRTIGNNAAAGVWTKAQAQGFQDRANQYSDDIDRAQKYLDLGFFNDARAQANLVNDLLMILSKEVADQARKAQP